MQGWKIFTHSVGLVARNYQVALKITLVLWLVPFVLRLLFIGNESFSNTHPEEFFTSPLGIKSFVLLIIQIICSIWMAINWHRFVLSEEAPNSYIPTWPGGRIGRYFVKSFLIGALGACVAIIAGMLLGFVAAAMGGPSIFITIIPLVSLAAIVYVFYRLCVVLPGVALDVDITFKEAWGLTRKVAGQIFLAAVLMVAIFTLLNNILLALFGFGLIGQLLGGLWSWALMIVGISLLTTIYGIAYENRELN